MTQHELYCGVCNKYTLHSLGLPRHCLVCKAKDEKDMAEALERIRLAEGLDLGENLNPGME